MRRILAAKAVIDPRLNRRIRGPTFVSISSVVAGGVPPLLASGLERLPGLGLAPFRTSSLRSCWAPRPSCRPFSNEGVS